VAIICVKHQFSSAQIHDGLEQRTELAELVYKKFNGREALRKVYQLLVLGAFRLAAG
jgi:hypothetical protein